MPRVLRQRTVPESRQADRIADGEAALLVVDEDEFGVEVVRRHGEGYARLPAARVSVPASEHLPVVAEDFNVHAAPPRTVEDALDTEMQPVGLVAYERALP